MAISALNRDRMGPISRQWDNYFTNFLVEGRNTLCKVDDSNDRREILTPHAAKELLERIENIKERLDENRKSKKKEATTLYADLIRQHLGEAPIEQKLLFTHSLYPHFLILQHSGLSEPRKLEALQLHNLDDQEHITIKGDALPDGICSRSQYFNSRSTWCGISLCVIKLFSKLANQKERRNRDVVKHSLQNFFAANYSAADEKLTAITWLYLTSPNEYDPILTDDHRIGVVKGSSLTLRLGEDPDYQKLLSGRNVDGLGLDIHLAIRYVRNKIVQAGNVGRADFDFYDPDVRALWDLDYEQVAPHPTSSQSPNEHAVHLPAASYSPESKSSMLPLNQIFYGPPGTGKTYHTVNAALEIIGGELSSNEDENRKRYNKLLEEGQIAAVTFHQNYDYTDFIEGIKPTLDDDVSEGIQYALVPGVFRLIATKAETNRLESHQSSPEAAANNALFQAYAEMITEELFDKPSVALPDTKWYIKNIKLKPDDTYGLKISADECSPVSLSLSTAASFYQEYKLGKIKKYRDLPSKNKSIQGHHGNATYYLSLLHSIKAFEQQSSVQFAQTQPRPKKNYVLVIDEINRGNVSAVFGELITLLEENKRLGNREATQVTLPYSKETFGVPNNLYIIATMNTADRSIAILDTALRRRFHFTEMMPKPWLLKTTRDGIDCKQLLEAINLQICNLHDREKQIGHSYLMNVESVQDVATVFKQQILPLLQEYFFDDWEKIYQVLNRSPLLRKVGTERAQRFEIRSHIANIWKDPGTYQRIYSNPTSSEEQASP